MSYDGKIVTAENYSLFDKIERRNAQKDLKAYLKGKPIYIATVFDEDKQKFVKQYKAVSRV